MLMAFCYTTEHHAGAFALISEVINEFDVIDYQDIL
jgi:hypothetical protein